jgi:hypothetical protein
MHRMALEIQRHVSDVHINKNIRDADIHYYINYGYYIRDKKRKDGLTIANFTHYDPEHLADQFREVAKVVDHCVAISESTAEILRTLGVESNKISTILIGADVEFKPEVTLGLVGRTYHGGRKGEHLIKALLEDEDVMDGLRIVAAHPGWGVPVRKFDTLREFYNSIDYLLVPALVEGGPVPFMEALACGKLSIAPPIGVIPQFPRIEYRTGDIDSLKSVIQEIKERLLSERREISRVMAPYNWQRWAEEHRILFEQLMRGNSGKIAK